MKSCDVRKSGNLQRFVVCLDEEFYGRNREFLQPLIKGIEKKAFYLL